MNIKPTVPRVVRFWRRLAWLILAGIALMTPVRGAASEAASHFLLMDSDGDGMPDSWEMIHGLNPNDPADGPQDPDGDHYSNRNEYLAGTDPHSAESVLRFTKIQQIASNEFFLQFKATSNKAYSVVFRADDTFTNWIKIRDFGPAPTNRLVELTNTIPPDMTGQRFYNVVTPPIL